MNVQRRNFLLTTAAFSASLPYLVRGKSGSKRPNIIFLMDDQRRWDALGIVDPAVITPNLDQLARRGVHYDQMVCQIPMCIPSRNSMMFSLYGNQLGIVRNGGGLPDHKLPVKPLAELFRLGGYQTAGFGKTHWGTGKPSTRGFDTRSVAECFEVEAVMMKDDAPEAKARYDAESKPLGPGEEGNSGYLGFTSPLPEKEHRDGWVTEQCLEFIESGIDSSRPLFLYLSFLKPHAGHNVPAGYEDLYDPDTVEYAKQPSWKEDQSPHALGVNRRELYINYWKGATPEQWRLMTMRYRANCTWIDAMFGRALNALEKQGVLDNALIIYCSDHGEMLGERYYRFNKYCLYESSIRAPLILSGSALPATMRGRTDQRNAELVDVYPTLLKAAGLPVPKHAVGLDLLGSNKRTGSFAALHEQKERAAFMWRTPEHKLILVMKRKNDASTYTESDVVGGEFYDLQAGPQEWHNLFDDATAFPEVRKAMAKDLFKHLKTQKKIS